MLQPVIILLNTLAVVIIAAAGIGAAALLVRMILQWTQANPFGWFALNLRRATEPLMRPLRIGFDNTILRYDLLPIVAAVLLLLYAFFASSIIYNYAIILTRISFAAEVTAVRAVVWLLGFLVNSYLAVLFLRFLLPFFGIGYSTPSFRLVFQVTEPVLKPLRRYFVIGLFDLSPLVVIFVLGWILQLLVSQM
jgi:YggT family protein